MTKAIGLVGVGVMGGAIATRLLADGWAVVVHDIQASRAEALRTHGAILAASTSGVARAASTILILVSDDQQVLDVIGELRRLRDRMPGKLVVIHSTIDPETAKACGEALAPVGIEVVDAAMTGAVEGARRGKLTLMVGGEKQVVASLTDVFASYAANILHIGPLGTGMTVKICVNLVLHANRLALYDGLQLCLAGGVNSEVFLDAVRSGTADSWVAQHWTDLDAAILRGGLGDHPLISQMMKDLSIALDVADRRGMDAPLALQALERLPPILRSGLPDR